MSEFIEGAHECPVCHAVCIWVVDREAPGGQQSRHRQPVGDTALAEALRRACARIVELEQVIRDAGKQLGG